MKIPAIDFLNINKIRPQNLQNINFCATAPIATPAIRPLPCDTFEKSAPNDTKTVTIKNLKGEDIQATIKSEPCEDTTGYFGKNPKKITINANGKQLGYALIYDAKREDALFIKELYTEENLARHYKGIGTELLKCAIEESKKRGYNGRITLSAAHFPAPFAFYYKNNFSVIDEISQYNAAIDYAARNDIPISKVLPVTMTALDMELDEKGARALLDGERLYEKRESRTIATLKAKGKEYQANYIEAPKEGFYLQIIDTHASEIKQKWVAKGKTEEDENGEKYLKIYSIDDIYSTRRLENFAKEAAQKLAEESGCKRVEMCEEFY